MLEGRCVNHNLRSAHVEYPPHRVRIAYIGKDCIVLDYSKTSLVAHWIRDEIRLIGENFYLGKVYWDKKRLIDFCLEFPKAK